MIVVALRSFAAARAAMPTPPHPNTAMLWPSPIWPVWAAAP